MWGWGRIRGSWGGQWVVREGYGVWGLWGDERHTVRPGSMGWLWGVGWKRVPGVVGFVGLGE